MFDCFAQPLMGLARIGNRSLGLGALTHHLADLERQLPAATFELRRRLDRTARHTGDRGMFCFFLLGPDRRHCYAPHTHSARGQFSDKYLKKWYLLPMTTAQGHACFAGAIRVGCIHAQPTIEEARQ
jgi:hypothetical protein